MTHAEARSKGQAFDLVGRAGQVGGPPTGECRTTHTQPAGRLRVAVDSDFLEAPFTGHNRQKPLNRAAEREGWGPVWVAVDSLLSHGDLVWRHQWAVDQPAMRRKCQTRRRVRNRTRSVCGMAASSLIFRSVDCEPGAVQIASGGDGSRLEPGIRGLQPIPNAEVSSRTATVSCLRARPLPGAPNPQVSPSLEGWQASSW